MPKATVRKPPTTKPPMGKKADKTPEETVARAALKHSIKEAPVPKLATPSYVMPVAPSSKKRSLGAMEKRAERTSQHHTKLWEQNAPVYQIKGVRIADLLKRGKNTKEGKEKAEARILEMENDKADAGSMMLVDEDCEPMLAVYSHGFPPQRAGADSNDIAEYPGPEGRTLEDFSKLEDCDWHGLQRSALDRYHQLTQTFHAYVPPVAKENDLRHPNDALMEYARVGVEEEGEGAEGGKVYERTGVSHLVHAWCQQGHPNGRLTPSADLHRSCKGAMAADAYFLGTKVTTKEISHRLQASFPTYAKKYSKAFLAGQSNDNDTGPFLGRALVWKMQVKAHQDGLDEGPAAIFPHGHFTGGYLYLPDIGVKLAYRPGDLVIFLAGHLYHAVGRWDPAPAPADSGLTPGRASSVFFFPKISFDRLEGKPPKWNINTMSGTAPDCRK